MSKIQLEILGLSASPASNGAYALILKETGGTRRLPIVIGAPEAQAIAVEMEGVKPPRPMTHDLLKNIIEQFGGTVSEVSIVDMKDSTFFAVIIIDGLSLEIDARPSDAIAIAVRFNAPIYITESILEEAGFYPENADDSLGDDDSDEEENDLLDLLRESKQETDKDDEDKEPPSTEGMSYFEQLKVKLAAAISKEDYEEAAKIRDEMQKIQSNG
ncbi:MAG: bifunctional nuclease family protein [Bacteriodetes bacterium]|nr:bifunctional nuclease family protein [Bacteroidota bacterium]